MADEKTRGTSPEEPPWDDVQADEPEVVSRDDTVVVRRVYHNVRVPEWPRLVIDASVIRPPRPEVALRETLRTMFELRVYYALVADDPGPAEPDGPAGAIPPDQPSRTDPVTFGTDDDRSGAKPDGEPPTEFSLQLDTREAPQDPALGLYFAAGPTILPHRTQNWMPNFGKYASVTVQVKGNGFLDVVFNPGKFAYYHISSKRSLKAEKTTVTNNTSDGVYYIVTDWHRV